MGDGLAYADMLAVVARSDSAGVNFRLVPTGQEAVLGKTRIDDLATLPLIDLEYNLHRPWNRFTKRFFDLAVSLPLVAVLYLPVRIIAAGRVERPAGFASFVLQLPSICFGTMSFVGYPAGEEGRTSLPPQSLGKPGLTGILQINAHSDLRPEERERYLLSYAKNHSLGLDLEILFKALLQRRRNL
jgi:lipopolysaccharide/colanic/teichoic acid biosynthesis glycosyltransferase